MTTSALLYLGLVLACVSGAATVRPLRPFAPRARAAKLALAGAGLAAVAALWPASRQHARGQASLLDRFTPAWEFDERHQAFVAAPPERVFTAVKQVRPGEIRLFLLLTGLRGLNPWRALGRGVPPVEKQPPLLEISQRGGFIVLGEEPGREVVQGTCSQFWRFSGGGSCPDIRTPEQFLAFEQPGYAKATINFRVEAVPGGSQLTTQTRILALDDGARRRFGVYWRIIYPGSALIRRGWLEAIKWRAEAG